VANPPQGEETAQTTPIGLANLPCFGEYKMSVLGLVIQHLVEGVRNIRKMCELLATVTNSTRFRCWLASPPAAWHGHHRKGAL